MREFLDNESDGIKLRVFRELPQISLPLIIQRLYHMEEKHYMICSRFPASTFRKKNIKNLYPLVYALSDGQRALADTMEISDLFHAAVMRKVAMVNKKDVEKGIDEVCEKIASDGEPLSVYEGVDRDQFSENAAMTSRATANMSSTENLMISINDMVYRYLIHSVLVWLSLRRLLRCLHITV